MPVQRICAMLGACGLLSACALRGTRPPAINPVPLTIVHSHSNGRLISVPVRIGSSRTLWFALDTGGLHTAVDSAVARQLGLPIVKTDLGKGAGHGTYVRRWTRPCDLAIGAVTLNVPRPTVIDLSHTGTRYPLAGLVGPELFERYVVRVDPVALTLALYDPRHFAYVGFGATVPLDLEREKLYVTMRLTLDNGTSVLHRMRIDSGSEDSVADNLVRESTHREATREGVGLGKSYIDYSGVFRTVQIGPYAIHEVWGPSDDQPTVGMAILRKFTLTFDVPHGRLYLEPNAYFNAPVPSPEPLSSN